MKTPDTNTIEAQEPTSAGCHDAACSPSSDTPETETLASTMFPDGSRWVQIEDCRKLERERNMWKKLHYVANLNSKIERDARMNAEEDLQRLRDAIKNLRDVKGRHNTEIATKRLFDLLENAKHTHGTNNN